MLNTNALIALTDLTAEEKTLLGIPTMSDALMESRINESSDWIENETGMKFIIQDVLNEEHIILRSSYDTKVFLNFRPVTSLDEIKDPEGTVMTLSNYIYSGATGIITGTFFDSLIPGGTWKFSYKAGCYANRAAIPAALKQAVKLVISWRWRITPELTVGGDMVPRMIKQALASFYSAGPTTWG